MSVELAGKASGSAGSKERSGDCTVECLDWARPEREVSGEHEQQHEHKSNDPVFWMVEVKLSR